MTLCILLLGSSQKYLYVGDSLFTLVEHFQTQFDKLSRVTISLEACNCVCIPNTVSSIDDNTIRVAGF